MAKKVSKRKASGSSAGKVADLRQAERAYLANLELCRAALDNQQLETQAIGQAIKIFEERVREILKS